MRQQISALLSRLHAAHPGATYELNWSTPEQLLVGTILAAQCTDERVNRVTAALFVKYPNAYAFAGADLAELEQDLRPTGFYKRKARTVKAANQVLTDRFGGSCPRTMNELLTIPGVARKTANVVLSCCFDLPTGIIVDTHVSRCSQRMGLSVQRKSDRVERDLIALIPRSEWTFFGPAMVLHGRYTCTTRAPSCAACPFADLCPRTGV